MKIKDRDDRSRHARGRQHVTPQYCSRDCRGLKSSSELRNASSLASLGKYKAPDTHSLKLDVRSSVDQDLGVLFRDITPPERARFMRSISIYVRALSKVGALSGAIIRFPALSLGKNCSDVRSKGSVTVLWTLGRWHFPIQHSVTMRVALHFVTLRLTDSLDLTCANAATPAFPGDHH